MQGAHQVAQKFTTTQCPRCSARTKRAPSSVVTSSAGDADGALESLRKACREPQTAYGLLPVMYGRPLRGFHRFLALGETVAHLNYLWHAGDLKRTVDDAGRIHFVAG